MRTHTNQQLAIRFVQLATLNRQRMDYSVRFLQASVYANLGFFLHLEILHAQPVQQIPTNQRLLMVPRLLFVYHAGQTQRQIRQLALTHKQDVYVNQATTVPVI